MKNDLFNIYRKAFCRLFPMLYSHRETVLGLDAIDFKLAENAFHDRSDDPETNCYCENEHVCLRKGLGSISQCYYGKKIDKSQKRINKFDF